MKKGFTLIELLAVIVILAIIALIATPIVLSIIEDTKESATLRSAEYYLSAVENSIAKKSLSIGGSFSPNVCEVQEDGNLLCDGTNELEIEVSGEKPSSGTITFEKGKIIAVELTIGNRILTKNEKGELVLGESKEEPVCKLISDADSSNTITPGDKYQCKVKDNMEAGWEDGYYFYVLSSEEDGTTNLIMDRNINSDGTPTTKAILETKKDSNGGIYNLVAWVSKLDYNDDTNYGSYGNHDKGPITAMNFLNNATSTWNNISSLDLIYNDEGKSFTNFKITGKARMPYLSEVSDYDGTNVYLYNYLIVMCFDNLDYMNEVSCEDAGYIDGMYGEGIENIDGIYGYWTLSSSPFDPNIAYFMRNDGIVGNAGDVKEWRTLGVRPVINIKL